MVEIIYFIHQVILASFLLLDFMLHSVLSIKIPEWVVQPLYASEARLDLLYYLYSQERASFYPRYKQSDSPVSITLLHLIYLTTLQADCLLSFFDINNNFTVTSVVLGTSNLLWPESSSPIISLTIKVVASVSFLIVIRGGVPRYRYDFLTKIGWVKFLIFIISLLLSTLLLYFSW